DRKFGAAGGPIRHYPGSPRFVRSGLRAGDRFVACELHPQEALALKREFAGDRAVEVHDQDGYHALKALLPPVEPRGLVLTDPPCEAADEFDRLPRALRQGLRRFATACYVVWYPIKDQAAVEDFVESFAALKALRIELRVPLSADGKLSACGLLIINPPWKFEEAMREALPWVAAHLAPGTEGLITSCHRPSPSSPTA